MKTNTILFIGLFFTMLSARFAAQPGAPITEFTVSSPIVCVGDAVQYTDLSQNNPTSWNWTFHNGSPATSTLQSPVVVYNNSGNYDAILMASNAQGTLTIGKLSAVKVLVCSGILEFGNSVVSIFPNPAQDYINVTIHSDAKFTLYDALGAVVANGDLKRDEINKISIDNFVSGVYFLNLQEGALTKTVKVVKQ